MSDEPVYEQVLKLVDTITPNASGHGVEVNPIHVECMDALDLALGNLRAQRHITDTATVMTEIERLMINAGRESNTGLMLAGFLAILQHQANGEDLYDVFIRNYNEFGDASGEILNRMLREGATVESLSTRPSFTPRFSAVTGQEIGGDEGQNADGEDEGADSDVDAAEDDSDSDDSEEGIKEYENVLDEAEANATSWPPL